MSDPISIPTDSPYSPRPTTTMRYTPKSDKPQSCFDEMGVTLQTFTKRIVVLTDEINTLQAQVLGVPSDKAEPPISGGPNAISVSIRDYMADHERALTNLEMVVQRFR